MDRVEHEGKHSAGIGFGGGRLVLYWSPTKFGEYTPDQREAVVEHEVRHVTHLHFAREGGRHHKLWNWATDIAINQFIKNLPPESLRPGFFDFPDRLSAEEYYELLQKKTGAISVPGNAEIDDHSKWGDIKEEDRAMAEEVAKEVVKNAISQGKLPHDLEDAVKDLMQKGQVPWNILLRRFVATAARTDFKYSWKRPSRRYGEDYKGKLTLRKLDIVVAIDTSGSIGNEEFQKFIAEVKALRSAYHSQVEIIECDAAVQKRYKLKRQVDTNFKGRGGTDFRPVFDAIKRCDVLLYLTDLYGTFPQKAPGYPVIWVSVTDAEVPWGRVIRIK